MKITMCIAAVLVAALGGAPVDVTKGTVRNLMATIEDFQRPRSAAPKLIEIVSADALAKAPVFRDDDGREAIGKQVDFSKEKLVVFAWKGSGTDEISHSPADKDGKIGFTFRAGTGEDVRESRVRAFAVPKDSKIELKVQEP
ncbi:unnamed protein product [Gemmata massiliana]|uniref:Uncharacterized protein n=1 Tax=Gemmata massiliana TaxID=1210884 RepID=A0A6P2D6Y9_9BACT|nr:hypothetical protein [Gemmata massiliana]VTR96687.1 unnamed protein product [Gemmata massiliana]